MAASSLPPARVRAENVRGPDEKIGDAYTIFSDPFTEPQNRDINKPDSVVSALAH